MFYLQEVHNSHLCEVGMRHVYSHKKLFSSLQVFRNKYNMKQADEPEQTY